MTYTLLQVLDILRAAPDHGGNIHLRPGDCTDLADAIEAHLSQPQPVAQGEVVAWQRRVYLQPSEAEEGGWTEWFDCSPFSAEIITKAKPEGRYPFEEVRPLYATPTIPTGHKFVPEDLPRPMCDVLAWHLEESRQGRHFFVQHVWDKLLAASPSAGGV